MDSVGAVLISIGRLFQSLGAALANTSIAPRLESGSVETTKSLKLADLKALAGWRSINRSKM